MKPNIKRLSALTLILSLCLPPLSNNIWASETPEIILEDPTDERSEKSADQPDTEQAEEDVELINTEEYEFSAEEDASSNIEQVEDLIEDCELIEEPLAANEEAAADMITYNAADFPNLSERTLSDVISYYAAAQSAGESYVNGTSSTYYDIPASTQYPYAAGVLSSDTLEAMEAMTNFYRWLIGVDELTVNTSSDASLQAQALDRNFEFGHTISADSKPADMDQELWDSGFSCNHNIIAFGCTPVDSITLWLNEGYNIFSNTWDTIGHRICLLDAPYSSILFGYSGSVAIGRYVSTDNNFENAFAAFPAAGYMPSELISPYKCDWSVALNNTFLKIENATDVVITVNNLTTQESYICTTENNHANVSGKMIQFLQPSDMDSSFGYYDDSYEVTITGLIDVPTGKAASLTYTVHFVDLRTSMLSYATITPNHSSYEYTGEAIQPACTVTLNDSVLTEGKDYEITYRNNVEPGLGIIEITGKGNYAGTCKKTFTISKDIHTMEIAEIIPANGTDNTATITKICQICGYTETLTVTTLTSFSTYWKTDPNSSYYSSGISEKQTKGTIVQYLFTGLTPSDAEKQTILVTSSDSNVIEVNSSANQLIMKNPGTAIITMEAEYNPSISKTYTFHVFDASDISLCSITLSNNTYTYDGNAKTPAVNVTHSSIALTAGTDYSVSYTNNVNAGTATVTITGKGNYTGTTTKTFSIKKANQTINVNIASSTIEIGKSTQIAVQGYGTIDYSSNNPSTASVSSSGLVSGKATGSCIITVTASGDENHNTAKTSVSISVVPISLSTCTVSLGATAFTYDGTAKTPSVTVKKGSVPLTKETDYSVAYKNNINAGTAEIIVTGRGNYSGSISKSFTINKAENNIIASDITKYTSTKAQSFYIHATSDGGTLTFQSGVYSSHYVTVDNTGKVTIAANCTGQATITIHAIDSNGNYKSAEKKITIFIKQPVLLSNTITASNFSKTYATKAQSFSIGATQKGTGKMTYSSNNSKVTVNSTGKITIKAKFIGKATITIKAAASGNFKAASKTITVTVKPPKVSLSSVSNVKGKKMTVKWKKSTAATGYQIQYSTNKTFSGSIKTVNVTKNTITSKTITGLKKNKTYYVRIRTYKTVSGVKYYSSWSNTKSAKIKK